MKTLQAVAAVLAVAGVLGACAPAARTHAGGDLGFLEGGQATERKGPTTVSVTNNNWANVNVYLLRGGTRYRLGMVTSMSTSVFRVPGTAVLSQGDVRLMVDPIGSSQGYVTPSLVVSPGDNVEFTIQNHLPVSSVSVWDE